MAEVRHPGELWLEIISDAGVTQTWLAVKMGVSTKHLNLIVKGHQRPNPIHTVLFARAMKIDVVPVWRAYTDWELENAKQQADLLEAASRDQDDHDDEHDQEHSEK